LIVISARHRASSANHLACHGQKVETVLSVTGAAGTSTAVGAVAAASVDLRAGNAGRSNPLTRENHRVVVSLHFKFTVDGHIYRRIVSAQRPRPESRCAVSKRQFTVEYNVIVSGSVAARTVAGTISCENGGCKAQSECDEDFAQHG